MLWVRGPALTAELARPAVIERAVHQAMRAFDLIVRAGGFASSRSTWPMCRASSARAACDVAALAHANEGRDTACLLVGDAPMGRSARGLSVQLDAARRWTGTSPQSRRLSGLTVQLRAGANGSGEIEVKS